MGNVNDDVKRVVDKLIDIPEILIDARVSHETYEKVVDEVIDLIIMTGGKEGMLYAKDKLTEICERER